MSRATGKIKALHIGRAVSGLEGPEPLAMAGQAIDRPVKDMIAVVDVLRGEGPLENDSVLAFYWSAPGVVFDDPYSPTPTGAFSSGTTLITLTLTDDVGDSTDTDTVLVEVVDTPPPVIASGRAEPGGAAAAEPAVDRPWTYHPSPRSRRATRRRPSSAT